MPLPPAKAWLSLLPSLTSGVALYVAWLAFSIDTNASKLEAAPPQALRVEFAKKYTNFQAQPSFMVMNPTRKVAVNKDLCLRIAPAAAPRKQPASFAAACRPSPSDGTIVLPWLQLARFDWVNEIDISVYEEMVSDALPMPVSIDDQPHHITLPALAARSCGADGEGPAQPMPVRQMSSTSAMERI
jgi:hypothetical protein